MALRTLLCLRCEEGGHVADDCLSEAWIAQLEDMRPNFVSKAAKDFTVDTICARCQSLNLIEALENVPPWKSQSDLNETFEEGHETFIDIGRIGSIELWSDCSLCRCLWAIAPFPDSVDQKMLLIPDWTLNRVAGELGAVKMIHPDTRSYATCLLPILKPSTSTLPAGIIAHRGDALCLMETTSSLARTLGARRLESNRINIGLVENWIESCTQRHDAACWPVPTSDLYEIRLIDVRSRQVVEYPGDQCQYVALSYVWGNSTQDTYKLGDTVKELPRTLEDAISFTKQLGTHFLWIDSVCIDQSDNLDKTNQINRMWSIYRAAYLTLIVLSGDSASAGISGFSRSKAFPQLTCQIKDKMIVSLKPTLSQQIWTCPWGQRAWTLQEGLLSPRCLYISDHQMYFDCSSMQCCETLDETRSRAHLLTPASNPTDEGFVTWMLREAGGGALRIPLDWPSRRLEHWGEKLNLYSYRDMKYSEDAIRAFAGVLQRLEIIYPRGFFCGLPREDFDWALLWRSQVPPQRREGFPTWSWAGWRGPLFFGQPLDVTKTRRIPTFLQIDAIVDGTVEHLIKRDPQSCVDSSGLSILLWNDPVCVAAQSQIRNRKPTAVGETLGEAPGDRKNFLFLLAVAFQFTPDFSTPLTGTYRSGEYETFRFTVQDVRCLIRITSTDRCIPGSWSPNGWVIDKNKVAEWTCLLIARDHLQGYILHHLMLVRFHQGTEVAERVTVFELLVPLDDLEVLNSLGIQKLCVYLV